MGSGISGSNFKVSTTYLRLRNQAFRSVTLNSGQGVRMGCITAWETLTMNMANVSHAVMHPMRTHWPELSVTDLKAWFRSRKYVVETLKLLPEMPEPIFIDQIIAKVAELGRVNQVVNLV